MAMQASDPHRGFRFEGRYTDSDLEALAQFTVSQFLDRRIGRMTVSATVLLALFSVLSRSWFLAIGGLLLILGIAALARYVVLPRRLLRHARQIPGLTGNRVLSMEGKQLRHQAEGLEQTFPPEAITRPALRKAHLFIRLKPHGCLMLPLAWVQAPETIDQVIHCLVRRNDD